MYNNDGRILHAQGRNRIGKSRILDAFDMFAREKRIRVVKLILHSSFAIKSYAVIYKILEQVCKFA
jgi:uncharacterized membrane protein YagU involved in acid resistance